MRFVLTPALRCLFIGIHGFSQAVVAAGEIDPSSLPPIIITGAGLPTALNASPGAVTVITRDQIDAMHPRSFTDVLRNVPGIYADQSGGRGGIGSVYLRGADPNYTLILVDGVKLNDPTNSRGGSVNLSAIDVESIERIEIISGPLSSVYGSDAIAGVINIETRMGASEREIQVHGGVGSHEAYNTGVLVRGPFADKSGYAVQIHTADDGTSVEGNQYEDYSLTANLFGRLSHDMNVSTSLRYADTHSESFPDDSGGPVYAQIREVDQRDARDISIGIQLHHQPRHQVEYMLKGDWFNHDETLDSPGVAPGVRDPFGIPANSSDSTYERYTLALHGRISLSDNINLGIGADLQHEQGRSDSTLIIFNVPQSDRFDLERDIHGLFVEMQYKASRQLAIHGGWRFDDPDGYGAVSSPRLGIIYHMPASKTTLKANWGEGFKLPSFFALGNPIVGNSDLRPETSASTGAGISRDFDDGKLQLGVDVFYSQYSDIIDFDAGPPPRLVNRAEVSAKGFELHAVLHTLGGVVMDSHISHTLTDIKDSDEVLRNRPEWQAGIGLRWAPRADIIVNPGFHYIGEVPDSSIPTGDVTLDSYIRTDVAMTWKARHNTDVLLSIDNIFDADYEQAAGFPAPGISGRLMVRVGL